LNYKLLCFAVHTGFDRYSGHYLTYVRYNNEYYQISDNYKEKVNINDYLKSGEEYKIVAITYDK